MSSTNSKDIDVPALFATSLHEVLPDQRLPAIDSKTIISDLGVDSISFMEVIGVLEDELGVKLRDEEITKIKTVGDVEQIISRKRKNSSRNTER